MGLAMLEAAQRSVAEACCVIDGAVRTLDPQVQKHTTAGGDVVHSATNAQKLAPRQFSGGGEKRHV